MPVFAVRGGLTTARCPPSPTVGGGLPAVVHSRSRKRHRSDDPDSTRTGTETGRGAQRRNFASGAAYALFVIATPHREPSRRAAIRCERQDGTQTRSLLCPPRPFLTCPRPLPGLVAPLATAGATLALARSDGAARLATRVRLPPDLLNRAGGETRHASRTFRRPLLTTGEATGATTAGKESVPAATREESRNISSRKTRETAGKSYESRLYFDCCRHDVEVL